MHYQTVKGILSARNGMNIYRGCTHGCIYCDSRSECYQINHDFEDVAVKINAPELLANALSKKRSKCMISTGSMSDPYLPIEKELQLTRKCISIINDLNFGFTVLTKSDLILRDIDLLKTINEKTKCVVQITLTTYDDQLTSIIEPNVALTSRRIEVLNIMKEHHIPTVVWLCPILPFINDNKDNISKILNACKEADVKGIICFGMGVTLRKGDREYFYQKLDQHFKGVKDKYIKTYGDSYYCPSLNEKDLMTYFNQFCIDNNILYQPQTVFDYLSTLNVGNQNQQLSLFEEGTI